MLAVRPHREAVVLATGQVVKVGSGDVGGEAGRSVRCLGRDHVRASPVPAVPAEGDDAQVTVHRGGQIVG